MAAIIILEGSPGLDISYIYFISITLLYHRLEPAQVWTIDLDFILVKAPGIDTSW